MRAVLTVVGKDTVGISARVTALCSNANVNVTEVTQTIQQDLFAMIMMIDLSESNIPFTRFTEDMSRLGDEMNLKIHVMHEDIFNSMHRI